MHSVNNIYGTLGPFDFTLNRKTEILVFQWGALQQKTSLVGGSSTGTNLCQNTYKDFYPYILFIWDFLDWSRPIVNEWLPEESVWRQRQGATDWGRQDEDKAEDKDTVREKNLPIKSLH